MGFFFLQDDFERLEDKIEVLNARFQSIGQEMGASCREGAETYHDNFAFEEGERQQQMLSRRLRELLRIRDRARVVRPAADGERVAIGRWVTVRDLDDGSQRRFRVGSYMTFNGDETVSYNAPVVRLLIGAQPGELREGEVAGENKAFEVLEVA